MPLHRVLKPRPPCLCCALLSCALLASAFLPPLHVPGWPWQRFRADGAPPARRAPWPLRACCCRHPSAVPCGSPVGRLQTPTHTRPVAWSRAIRGVSFLLAASAEAGFCRSGLLSAPPLCGASQEGGWAGSALAARGK